MYVNYFMSHLKGYYLFLTQGQLQIVLIFDPNGTFG